MVLSSLACLLLLPTLISAHMTISEVPVNLAAHHVKQLLATPLKNLLQKRDTVLFAGSPTASNILALNSTNGQVVETIPFQEKIYIPGQGPEIYFIVRFGTPLMTNLVYHWPTHDLAHALETNIINLL